MTHKWLFKEKNLFWVNDWQQNSSTKIYNMNLKKIPVSCCSKHVTDGYVYVLVVSWVWTQHLHAPVTNDVWQPVGVGDVLHLSPNKLKRRDYIYEITLYGLLKLNHH